MFGLPIDVYLERMVDILDVDGNRTIDFREFVVGLAAFVLSGTFGRVRFAFRLFDLNNDGCFSKEELLVAITSSEERYKDTKEYQEKRKDTYWGDKRREDAYKPYKNLIRDLEVRHHWNPGSCVRYVRLLLLHPSPSPPPPCPRPRPPSRPRPPPRPRSPHIL